MEIGSYCESIVAVATPAGRGGIGIIRISGSRIEVFCAAILGCVPKPRVATYLPFLDANGTAIDEGIALYFPSPSSFTGEEILELQAHGGRIVLDLLMARTLELGARIARPGEFSERAFLNGKIDLLQAEAVADLIEAGTVRAARSARRAIEGAFSIRVNELVEELKQLRVYIEAAIDFSEEEMEFLSDGIVCNRLSDLQHKVQTVLSTARQGCLFREGITLVIAGKPNSGKSSLLNALTNKDTAIVTSYPGTTRDVLRETIQIEGIPVHVIDTAGLRHSEDLVEQEGIRRARKEITQADLVLWMIDANNTDPEQSDIDPILYNRVKVTKILNKIDLVDGLPNLRVTNQGTEILLSVKSGAGMNLLYQHIKDSIGYNEQMEDVFIARRRHIDALNAADAAIREAQSQLTEIYSLELIAEELRQAQRSLMEITGAFTTDDLLARIFAAFCVGK